MWKQLCEAILQMVGGKKELLMGTVPLTSEEK